MDRQAKIDVLNRVLHGTVNSVLQYVEASTPYVSEEAEEQWEEILRIRDEEIELILDLRAAISALDGIAAVGVFPYWNIDLNYLDLDWMAGFAKKHQDGLIGELVALLPEVRSDARIHGLLSRVLEKMREHSVVLARVAGDGAEAAEVGEAAEE